MSDPADRDWAPPDPGAVNRGPEQAEPLPAGAYPAPYPHQYGLQPPFAKVPWTVPTPAGSPYHRMARTAAHRWWRPLVGTFTILFGGFAMVIVLGIVALIVSSLITGEQPNLDGTGDSILGNDLADLGLNLATLAVFLPFALLVPWLVQRRRPGTVSSVVGRLRWRWLLVCAGLAIAFCAVSYGTMWLADLAVDDPAEANERWVGWGRFLAAAAVIVLLVPFQASAEEYVFRGWLLQAVGACTLETARGRVGRALSVVFRTPWPGIVVGGALFTSGHGYTGWGILDIFAFGVIAGWITVRSGGLEASIALHVFNNFLAFLAPAAVGRLDIVQGAVPWQYVLADVVPMILYALGVLWLVRRLGIETTVPGPAEAEPEPIPAASGH
ncbi:CAAX amino protease [Actinomadura sp. NBRC 104412]|uniref:CPBP family glutamic-type intramembrane protease n=1 Tax=Actinomadura sp. NBRC 104412 TaxID=3032203 RepID=UPI0024A28FF7|nr:CPBP family glutamic-type intramembrane protease [Actinomadura sp. NBRC 104412]GLZ06992.1 CAAX amino protease [Actinomadura sp. NBRC 104412]